MKRIISLAPAVSLFAATSALAQDADDQATNDAVQAATDAIKQAVESADASKRYERYVTPLDYDDVRPRPVDYPIDAWQAGHEGRVEYHLSVDAAGMPTACEILQSSGHRSLDEATCAFVMERAKFDPARDEEGNPVAGTYEDAHYWRKREPEFPGTMKVHVVYTLDETGRSSKCEVIEISGEVSEQMRKNFEREPCPGINRPARAPYRDDQGNPVARRVELIFDVKVDEPPN